MTRPIAWAVVISVLTVAGCRDARSPRPGPVISPSPDASDATERNDDSASIVTLEVDTVRRLCARDADCSENQSCCVTGRLGTCVAVQPGTDCPRPDLVVFTDAAEPPRFSESSFGDESFDCSIEKGCIGGAGARRLLRFTLHTANIGDGDFILGVPGMPGIEQSACDLNLYSPTFLRYELVTLGGALVAEGMGTSSQCALTSQATQQIYDCSVLGLQRHSAYTYSEYSECQWLDVTNVPADDYLLRVTINAEGRSFESNPDNNVLELPIRVPERNPLLPCDDGTVSSFADELECGWSLLPNATGVSCNPGDTVRVACKRCDNQGPTRICAGNRACSAVATIASTGSYQPLDETSACGADASCEDSFWLADCETLEFACPPSGAYTLLANTFIGEGEPSCILDIPPSSP